MNVFQGIAAAPGLIYGKAIRFLAKEIDIESHKVESVDYEIERLHNAVNQAKGNLTSEKQRMSSQLGSAELEIYEAHISILEDPELKEMTISKIKDESCNCDYAFDMISKNFQQQLLALNDPYLSARAQDIKEVTSRVITIINGEAVVEKVIPDNAILVCQQLTTHQLSTIDTKKISAIISSDGGLTDHVAIISKALGIPLVVGLKGQIDVVQTGHDLIVNGHSGEVVWQPDSSQIEVFRSEAEIFAIENDKAYHKRNLEAVTKSGSSIKVYANVAEIEDVDLATENGAEGIGLLRTELTFISSTKEPSEQEHYSFYKEVLARMQGKETVIRLLDFGSDKTVDYLKQDQEENPAMGLRALRLGFKYYETLLAPQIRSLLRLASEYPVQVLCPMIATLADFVQIKNAFATESADLASQDIPHKADLEIGIMVEVPYVAFFPEVFVKEVDFFSFGTNDLAQFLMAADRANSQVANYLNDARSGILKLIEKTIKVAHKEGKWVGICGELSSDKSLLQDFIAMKVDEISMPPALIPSVKEYIRMLD
jgi:phosphotransferase system enzyme I (PtsI)